MPDLLDLPRWARITGRAMLVAGYLFLAAAGAFGMTWPPGLSLEGWAFAVTRVSGGVALAASLIGAYAALRRRWLLELDVLWLVGLGLTGYAAVLLLYVGPQREWLLVTALIGSLLCGLAGRGVKLLAKVQSRLDSKRKARGGR